ncbi:MAG: energy-coupling factor ABC transporter permease [Hyphomicrobiaceae bacterium]
MHIEPGLVDASKIVLSYATAAAAGAFALKRAVETVRESGIASFAARAVMASAMVFSFFEVLPHYPMGVSEVHFILGSTLFLILGAAPAAFGLAAGLLIQGLFFAPHDLPQYAMNLTTLLVPLFAVAALAERVIAKNTPYVELSYKHALALSTAFQGGIITWVAFWAIYGRGVGVDNLAAVATFGAAYLAVMIIEPIADLAVLWVAKSLRGSSGSGLVTPRLHSPA